MKCQWLIPSTKGGDELVKCGKPATATRRVPIMLGASAEIDLCDKHAGEHDGRRSQLRRQSRRGGRR